MPIAREKELFHPTPLAPAAGLIFWGGHEADALDWNRLPAGDQL